MARRATTRSQLSPQFHCGYVFCARHSKIPGVCGSRAITFSTATRHVFAGRSRARSLQDGHAGYLRDPRTFLALLSLLFGRDGDGSEWSVGSWWWYEIEIESDKSSANCIRTALQPVLLERASTTITDLSPRGDGRIPSGLDRRETRED